MEIASLQWSHDLSAMDTVNRRMNMFGDVVLQWSHDLSAMDTAIGTILDDDAAELQWSHDLSAMDTIDSFVGVSATAIASMEP